MEHGARKHYTFGGSGAHRWMRCWASTYASRGVPDSASRWADDGTDAHELLDFCLQSGEWSAAAGLDMLPPKVDLDAEGLTKRSNSVQVALDYVKDLLDTYEDAVLVVEKQYRFPSVHTDDAGGTVDVGVYIPSFQMLHIVDYKNGTIVVDAEDNEQTDSYAAQLIFGPDAPFPEAETVVKAIVQPNAFGVRAVRTVVTSAAALAEFIERADYAIAENLQTEIAASHGLDISDAYVPGEKQCQWCPARFSCQARDTWYAKKAGANFNSVVQLAAVIPPTLNAKERPGLQLALGGDTAEDVARKMPAYEAILEFLKDYIQGAEQRIHNGENIPGYKLVLAQARSKWYLEKYTPEQIATAVMALLATDDWDEVMPRKLIGITDVKDKAKAAYIAMGFDAKKAAQDSNEALAEFIDKRSSGNYVVMTEDDRRPAVQFAQDNFAGARVLPQK